MPKVSDDYLDEIAREGKNLNLRYMARELQIMRRLEKGVRYYLEKYDMGQEFIGPALQALAAYQEAIEE